MSTNTVGAGNFHTGYISRQLGRTGIQSTARRIEKMLENKDNKVYPESSISYIKFKGVIWQLSDNNIPEDNQSKEIIKRLLQQLEVKIFYSLSEEKRKDLTEEFENI